MGLRRKSLWRIRRISEPSGGSDLGETQPVIQPFAIDPYFDF
jgi:hypothetical protein